MQPLPFQLDAITLRGVGSYLKGARLDLKPLTVLCGKNGSGKSTWMKALNLLRDWHDEGAFPFAPASDHPFGKMMEDSPQYDDYTNAYLQDAGADAVSRLRADTVEEALWGVPGTIGLEFTCTSNCALPAAAEILVSSAEPHNSLQSFLWRGQCQMGTRYRLRVSQSMRFETVVELCVGNAYRLILSGVRHDFGRKFLFSCSEGFLADAKGQNAGIEPVANVFQYVSVRRIAYSNSAA